MKGNSAKLVVAFSRSYNLLFALIEKDVRNYGLTISEFGVLEALLHKGNMPVQKLREKVLVTSGSMTYIVDKLQEKGYVRRYKCKKDARIWFVSLTDMGKEFISDIYPRHDLFLQNIMGGMDAQDKTELIQGLFRMRKVLEEEQQTDTVKIEGKE